jgi:hypothetical protein
MVTGFFDSPGIIQQLAQEQSIELIELGETSLFYYEAYEMEFMGDESIWEEFKPEPSFKTQVVIPARKVLEGYDLVSFSMGNSPECSPLSCNGLANKQSGDQSALSVGFFRAGTAVINKQPIQGSRTRAIPDIHGLLGKVALVQVQR